MSERNGIGNNGGPSSGAEPSMEEILASIRRILTEEESERAATPPSDGEAGSVDEADDDILVLGSTAMVNSSQAEPKDGDAFGSTPTLDSQAYENGQNSDGQMSAGEAQYIPVSVVQPNQSLSTLNEKENNMDDQVQSPQGLVGDKLANEIANTVGSLVRSVSSERAVQIGRPGVTIEDLVREEVKPVLKAWLDSHLPSLVERVVRAEIGRVIDRM
ncbi:DUF2497 domain-containing protein [Acidocella sp.]|uniref:DUF2497 domain-containing protein n=1 Tax=Acidocella sp. TaxID=50710 RepID=UPI00262BD6E4|nr:DUF2497 domain-containing protein [Acidocella sp.]